MKVKQLIAKLEKLDKNKEIGQACDSEGNAILVMGGISELKTLNMYCIFPLDKIIE
jgi:hypothetical protein